MLIVSKKEKKVYIITLFYTFLFMFIAIEESIEGGKSDSEKSKDFLYFK